MANTIHFMESANLFCGDHDPSDSKHLTLEELKLPDFQKMFVDHHPGGSPMQVEIAVGMQKLEPTFKLKGHDSAMLTQFGLGGTGRRNYTAYGVIRDKRTGNAAESVAVIEACLGKIAPDAFKRGEVQGHEYALNEVMHYELTVAGQEIFYWDFWTNAMRSNGVDLNAETNRILGIG